MSITNTTLPQPAGATTAGKHLRLALVVIAAAQLVMVLDSTIINVALPTIHTALHFSTANLEWVVTAYAVTFGGLLLFGGRTGDLYGKRRMFMVGIAIFVVSSLLGGLAQNDIWLIVTRACQGIGAAIVSPTALALIATNFPEGKSRNRALGAYAAMAGGGGAFGLLLGGILTDWVSWRWIFFVNVPIGLLILFLAPRVLNESETTSGRLDVPGALTVTSGMMAFVYGLSHAAGHPWGSLGTIVPLALAALLLVSFAFIESRSVEPLMPLRILKDRNRSGSYAVMFCIAIAILALFYFLTQFLQNIRGWSPIMTGIGFLPITAGIVVAAVIASRLVGRVGVRLLLLIGPGAVVVGLAWLSRLTPSSSYLDILGPMLSIALGMGLTFFPLTLTAVSGVPPEDAGLASALLDSAQQVGGALGLAVLATVAIDAAKSKVQDLAVATHGHVGAATVSVATTHGYATALEVGAGGALLGLIVSLLVIRTPRPKALASGDIDT